MIQNSQGKDVMRAQHIAMICISSYFHCVSLNRVDRVPQITAADCESEYSSYSIFPGVDAMVISLVSSDCKQLIAFFLCSSWQYLSCLSLACITKECTYHELIVFQVQYCESALSLWGGR